MSCPHEDTTLLWLYGEADDAHAAHVAGCASCQALADTHLDVLGAVAEVAPALSTPARSTSTPAPAHRPWAWAGLALAAAAVLAVVLQAPTPTTPAPSTALSAIAPVDTLDLRLDALDDELALLSIDLETL